MAEESSAAPGSGIEGSKLGVVTGADDRTVISRYLGRKFIGFLTATGLLCYGLISADDWKFAFVVYCAADVFEKIAPLALRKKGSSDVG